MPIPRSVISPPGSAVAMRSISGYPSQAHAVHPQYRHERRERRHQLYGRYYDAVQAVDAHRFAVVLIHTVSVLHDLYAIPATTKKYVYSACTAVEMIRCRFLGFLKCGCGSLKHFLSNWTPLKAHVRYFIAFVRLNTWSRDPSSLARVLHHASTQPRISRLTMLTAGDVVRNDMT